MKTMAITFAESEGLTPYALSADNLEQVAGGTDGGHMEIVEVITKGLVKVLKSMQSSFTFLDFREFEAWYLPREKVIDTLLYGYVRPDYYRIYMVMSDNNRKEIRENVYAIIVDPDPDPEMWF